ncbi:3-oxoacyl-reductase [Trichodelitschia bisporula]|uniref:3-oxoacyl-reductase n=1 Tax=Trichodelitschia bisporula TaxID=703511 RepID=A0A6G1HZZ2_9PEZI|nr:3-oxoacyl-reductase [Trichodelitschia bisporula]
MTAAPKRAPPALSQILVEGFPPADSFEGVPRVRSVAGESAGPRMKDKICVITGANSALGIGRATAHQFARNGAKAIFLCDFAGDLLAHHKREITSLYPGTEVHTRQFDASDEEGVKGVVDEAVKMYGRLDVFFANAGISGGKIFTETSVDEFMRMMKVNTLSVFLAAKHAARAMTANKPYPSGSIIGTASVAGIRSNAGGSDYSASKAAVVSLMQTIAYQLAGTGIRANAICPGIIETGMTAPMYEMARARGTDRKIGQLNPLRRGGVADEVARVVLFLASDEASYVNGQAIPVCGGLSAGHPFVPGKLA